LAGLFAFSGEGERGRVDAVAQACGPGAVREDVAEMAAAAGAGDLDAAHTVTQVLVLIDGFGAGGDHEAGPAAARVELGAAHEEQRATCGAVVVAGFVIFSEEASEGALGAFFTQYVILLGREHGLPLGVAADDLLLGIGLGMTQGDLLRLRGGAMGCGEPNANAAETAGHRLMLLLKQISLKKIWGSAGQTSATTSISTSRLRGKRATSTVVRAGRVSLSAPK